MIINVAQVLVRKMKYQMIINAKRKHQMYLFIRGSIK